MATDYAVRTLRYAVMPDFTSPDSGLSPREMVAEAHCWSRPLLGSTCHRCFLHGKNSL